MKGGRCVIARLITLLIVVLGSGCKSATADATNVIENRVHFGFDVGDSIAPFVVDCLKAGTRELGTSGASQIVTFSSPGDCSICMPHLAGLDSIALAKLGPPDNVLVTYAPGRSPATVARLYGSRMARDVCVDTGGRAWDALHLNKTPVTVLLVSGRVAYLTNADMLSPASRAGFLRQVDRKLRATTRP
jgi:hypothetical protein